MARVRPPVELWQNVEGERICSRTGGPLLFYFFEDQLILEALFFIILFTYLLEVDIAVWPWVI